MAKTEHHKKAAHHMEKAAHHHAKAKEHMAKVHEEKEVKVIKKLSKMHKKKY
jgi:hypothetical protein